MIPVLIWFAGLMVLCTLLHFVVRRWDKEDQQVAEFRSACKFNDRDCYSVSQLCPNGYCLVHCVCTCRVHHEGT